MPLVFGQALPASCVHSLSTRPRLVPFLFVWPLQFWAQAFVGARDDGHDAAASRCRAPIATGHPGFDLVPLVIDAVTIPDPNGPATAIAGPELAVLAMLTGPLYGNFYSDKCPYLPLAWRLRDGHAGRTRP